MDEYKYFYADIMKKTVEENDKWHIWLYSSPSNGNKVGQIINQNPQDNNFGDGKSLLLCVRKSNASLSKIYNFI